MRAGEGGRRWRRGGRKGDECAGRGDGEPRGGARRGRWLRDGEGSACGGGGREGPGKKEGKGISTDFDFKYILDRPAPQHISNKFL